MSILLIDDDTDSLTLLSNILRSEGFDTRAADDGSLALASLSVNVPELILLDIRMPRMDGFEVCRRLKARPDTCDIPVIFLSAASLKDRLAGFRLGAVDFISKPFQREELLARVRTHLELSRLRAHLEKRVAERTAELRESEQRFRTMADAAPVMIWSSAPDKGCDFFNTHWLQFTGRTSAQEAGSGWADSVHADDLDRCWNTYASAFDARRAFEMEYRLRRHDGEYRWVLDRGCPRFSPNGDFAGYIGSCVDITVSKQSSQHLLASQKFESLGAMAAGVAHDFGNLLGAILSEVDLASSELSAGSAAHENLERIAEVAARGTELVQMLMATTGAGASRAEFEHIDLSTAVRQILRLAELSISKRATLRSHLPPSLPPVFGNAAQIHQVILNLVTNASDALQDQPGTITITTAVASPDTEALGLSDGDYLRLGVSDTGCGMDAEIRSRIFDPFFTTKPKGRGLGLAAVHGIVRSHGGAIAVDSAPGAGTTFAVWLPCVASAVRSAGSR